MKNMKQLLLAIMAILFVYGAYRTGAVGLRTANIIKQRIPSTAGMDTSLAGLVDRLESAIARRLAYQVTLSSDPLKLDRILNVGGRAVTQKKESAETNLQMRLSCTIVSDKRSTAIIKYKGESFVVAQGDSIAGKRVMSIDQKTVVLDDNGKEIVLYNTPAPPSEIQSKGRRELEEIQL